MDPGSSPGRQKYPVTPGEASICHPGRRPGVHPRVCHPTNAKSLVTQASSPSPAGWLLRFCGVHGCILGAKHEAQENEAPVHGQVQVRNAQTDSNGRCKEGHAHKQLRVA